MRQLEASKCGLVSDDDFGGDFGSHLRHVFLVLILAGL